MPPTNEAPGAAAVEANAVEPVEEPYTTKRWRSTTVRLFAAMDTMPQIAERILGILGSGRVMNTTSALIGSEGLPDLRRLELATGLKLGGHAAYPEGHNVWQRDDQAGIGVYLTHEHGTLGTLAGFGINVQGWNAATEADVQARYDRQSGSGANPVSDRIADITYVELHGRPGDPHRNDRIEILDWNTNSVLRHTVITFVEPDYCDSGRVTELNYVILAHRKDPSRPRFAARETDPEVLARVVAATGPDGNPSDETRASARAEAACLLRELQAGVDIDYAWIAEEKVVRERRSTR